jgi:hypothetical protein
MCSEDARTIDDYLYSNTDLCNVSCLPPLLDLT